MDRALPGPGASRYVQRSVSLSQWQELLVSKSIYQLKEADPHSWAIPRLAGDAKTALVEIQYDEYGAGRRGRQHGELFAATMRLCGLDPTYGAYLDAVPVSVLALNNLMTMLGLHRRLVAGIVGHLALYESTSCLPNKHYAVAARRSDSPRTWSPTSTSTSRPTPSTSRSRSSTCWVPTCAITRPTPRCGFGVAAGALLDNGWPVRARLLARRQAVAARAGRVSDIELQPCDGGPLLVRGASAWTDDEGTAIRAASGGRGVPLRQFSLRPWCDGTHKLLRVAVDLDARGSAS